jgi:hypothetical protein
MLAACGGGTDASGTGASGTSSASIASTGSSSSSSTAGAPVVAGSTSSASGSVIPSATQLIDASHSSWTLNNGVVYKNGAAAAYSANVVALLYYGGVIYQESKTCLWWSWNGSGWVATSNPNPGTVPPCSSSVASAGSSADIPNAAVAPTPTGEFGVQVKGNRLVSAKDGTPIEIVGTNVSGLETGMVWRWAAFVNAGSAFWSKVRNWNGSGVNAVRLPLNEASWLNYTCYDDGAGSSHSFYTPIGGGAFQPDPKDAYQATVKKAVADATAAGLYVILDLHWGSPNNAVGQPLCPIGQPAYADADHSLAFWKSVADTFKNNPAVMFELFNEPFGSNVYTNWVHQSGSSYSAGPDAIMLRDGGANHPFLEQNNSNGVVQTTNLTWHVAGMQEMVDTIRGEGAANVILSAPIGWAGEIETWLSSKPSDPIGQLGMAWHVYGYKKGQTPAMSVLAAGYPVVITETYGLGTIGGYGWAASHGIGYTWWGWNDWAGQALSAMLGRAPWFASSAP